MPFEKIKEFLLNKIRVKKFKVYTEENFLQIDYEAEENQDIENIIVSNIEEMWCVVKKEMHIDKNSNISMVWSENLLLIS